jgi:hypothetical protein
MLPEMPLLSGPNLKKLLELLKQLTHNSDRKLALGNAPKRRGRVSLS